MECQANSYQAFFDEFETNPLPSNYRGVFIWLLRVEQSSGGTSDNDYTFAAKPAVNGLM
jgi:hypothetical protein